MTHERTKPQFPEVIDNTFREAFTNCHQKFYWNALRRKASSTPNIHLHAGGAFAKAVETTRRAYYEQSYDAFTSVAMGHDALCEAYGDFDSEHGYLDHNKSCANVLRAFEDYWMEYNLDHETLVPVTNPDGSRGIEFSFAFPTNIRHPVTGNPILYAGRFDMLGERDGKLWVVDEKTTSSLGDQWSKQWDLNSQFTGYCMAAREYGYPVVGAIIRGVGLLKTKISHAQVPIYRPDWQINRWWEQLHRDLSVMIALWQNDDGSGKNFDYALGGACSHYGGCLYKKLCISPSPEEWLAVDFVDSTWSPLQVAGD